MNVYQKGFIEELRSLSGPMKKKVLFCAAALSMIIVISLWLAYFNTIVPDVVPIGGQTVPPVAVQGPGGPGIVGLFADAADSFFGVTLNSAQGIISALKNSKQYNISPQ